MRTANLTGALLDYWTARAEGVPADQLEIRPVQRPDPRTPDTICVRRRPRWASSSHERLDYSTNWALAGPLPEKHRVVVRPGIHDDWVSAAQYVPLEENPMVHGDTPLIAICRAVVRAAFGDEVEDLPC